MHGRRLGTIVGTRIPALSGWSLRNAGMEHVGFSTTTQISRAPSTNNREVFGELHKG